jgi:AcrR family transcriptional regulator
VAGRGERIVGSMHPGRYRGRVMAGVKGQVQRRGVERRHQIVQAALELFTKRGARGTSIADVADRVGISAPAVLHHFGTKDDLLMAVIQERDRRVAIEFTDLVSEGGLAGLRRLVDMGEALAQERGLMAAYVVFLAENLHDGDVAHRYFVDRTCVTKDFLAGLLREGQKTGEVRTDIDAETKAGEITAFLHGAAMQWAIDPSIGLAELYRSYVDTLVRDLAA